MKTIIVILVSVVLLSSCGKKQDKNAFQRQQNAYEVVNTLLTQDCLFNTGLCMEKYIQKQLLIAGFKGKKQGRTIKYVSGAQTIKCSIDYLTEVVTYESFTKNGI